MPIPYAVPGHMPTILLVTSDSSGIPSLTQAFRREGYRVHLLPEGNILMQAVYARAPDLIILDSMPPLVDGLSLCWTVRTQSAIPIVILSDRDTPIDKIVGLGAGADDYITKPFSIGEFTARIRALFRRTLPKTLALEYGSLRLNLQSRRAFYHDQELSLNVKEFELLTEFMRNPGRVLSRTLLLQRVWGHDQITPTRTVDMHVSTLRKKVNLAPGVPGLIHTVPGIGYRFGE